MANGINGVNPIEISESSKLLATYVKEKIDSVSPSPFGRFCCIYKVQKKFRKITEYAYTPEMVSIGPFHHGQVDFQELETHKLRYVYELLNRIGNPVEKLEECMEAMSRVEDDIRKCYSEPVEPDKTKFIAMMVIDGLFIIELFRKSAGEENTYSDDPIFNTMWGTGSLVRDMILLENQLPMFVLEQLFDITMANQRGKPLNELAIRFFNPLMQREEEVLENYFKTENYLNLTGSHLLDILNKAFHDWPHEADTTKVQKLKHVPCATELRQAGVKFRRGCNEGSVVDIRLEGGVLIIPPIIVTNQRDSFLRNMIASEQCCDGPATHMVSYAFLKTDLIKSPNDVKFLCKKGIIKNSLGDSKSVSSLFDKLSSEVIVPNYYYYDLCDQLNEVCNTRWHVLLATLRRDYFATLKHEYFDSPWKVISVTVAGVLVILTLISALFAMLSFFVHEQ